jgi:uncharacterized membrane protein YccF (DUF307 family)
MASVGNFFWFLIIGWWNAIIVALVGVLFCITIIGIPIGKSLFQLAKLLMFPFGKTIIRETELKGKSNVNIVRKIGGVIANIIWFPFGLFFFVYYILLGAAACVTIVFIPFGIAMFRVAKFVIFPIGAKVVSKELAQAAATINMFEKRGYGKNTVVINQAQTITSASENYVNVSQTAVSQKPEYPIFEKEFDPDKAFSISDETIDTLTKLQDLVNKGILSAEELIVKKDEMINHERDAWLRKVEAVKAERSAIENNERQLREEQERIRNEAEASRLRAQERRENIVRSVRLFIEKKNITPRKGAAIGGIIIAIIVCVVLISSLVTAVQSTPPSDGKIKNMTTNYLLSNTDAIKVNDIKVALSNKSDLYASYELDFDVTENSRRVTGVVEWSFNKYKRNEKFPLDEIPYITYTAAFPLSEITLEEALYKIDEAVFYPVYENDGHLEEGDRFPHNLGIVNISDISIIASDLDNNRCTANISGSAEYLNTIGTFSKEISFTYKLAYAWTLEEESTYIPVTVTQKEGTGLSAQSVLELINVEVVEIDGNQYNVADLSLDELKIKYADYYTSASVTTAFEISNSSYALNGTLMVAFENADDIWSLTSVVAYSDSGVQVKEKLTDAQVQSLLLRDPFNAPNGSITLTREELSTFDIQKQQKSYSQGYFVTATLSKGGELFVSTYVVEADIEFEPGTGYILTRKEVSEFKIELLNQSFSKTFLVPYTAYGNISDMSDSGFLLLTFNVTDGSRVAAELTLFPYSFYLNGTFYKDDGQLSVLTSASATDIYVTYRILITTSANIKYDVTLIVNSVDWEAGKISGRIDFDTIALGVDSFSMDFEL